MSTSPKTPKDGDFSGGGAAGERVVATAGAVELPVLTRTNYHEWSLVMQVSLEALGLWDAVKSGDKAERREDRSALAAILRGVPTELKAVLAVKATAKEAWEAVKSMRVGVERVKTANVQRLTKDFENLRWRDGESVDDFAVRVNTLVGGLRELGEDVKDGRVVRKVLRVVPRKWKHVAVSIEMLLDLDKMKMEELVGRLRVVENADEEDAAEVEVARLNLVEERRDARRRQERARGGDGRHGGDGRRGMNGGRNNGGDRRHGGGDRGNDGDDEQSNGDDDTSSVASGSSRRGWSRNSGQCFECGKYGHIAKFCRKKKREEKALQAIGDEEPVLL